MSGCEKKDTPDDIRESVRRGYAHIAEQGGSCCGPSKDCCGTADPGKVAQSIGYSEAELSTLPEGANMGLSCGNPGALAALQPGETVLDLGAGGGFDVFLVAQKVGPAGLAIGVDMTPEMVSKARRNAEGFRDQTGLDNVDFRLGEIEHLPAADGSVDVVISNCVINLSPNKAQVWREVFRVLKPGGRVAVSDLALLKPLPNALRHSVEALIGCVAGAVLIRETETMMIESGFIDRVFEEKRGYVESMSQWNDPLYCDIIAQLSPGEKLSDYITSLNISAAKPHC